MSQNIHKTQLNKWSTYGVIDGVRTSGVIHRQISMGAEEEVRSMLRILVWCRAQCQTFRFAARIVIKTRKREDINLMGGNSLNYEQYRQFQYPCSNSSITCPIICGSCTQNLIKIFTHALGGPSGWNKSFICLQDVWALQMPCNNLEVKIVHPLSGVSLGKIYEWTIW